MHFFIHGDYHRKSRELLQELKHKFQKENKEQINLNGLKITLDELIQASTSQSMFAESKVVVIENLFSRPNSKTLNQILEWLKLYKGNVSLILWEKKSIGKVLQRRLPQNTTIKEFKTPAIIFKLVENIKPNNLKILLNLYNQVLQLESAEFIFLMISRQIRLLIMLISGEKINGAPWIISKLKKQASNFEQKQLVSLYQQLYRIDKDIKTGKSILPLAWKLKQWLLEL